MKATPATSFMLGQAKFLLEVMVVALDAPPPAGLPNEIGKRGIGRQSGNQDSVGVVLVTPSRRGKRCLRVQLNLIRNGRAA